MELNPQNEQKMEKRILSLIESLSSVPENFGQSLVKSSPLQIGIGDNFPIPADQEKGRHSSRMSAAAGNKACTTDGMPHHHPLQTHSIKQNGPNSFREVITGFLYRVKKNFFCCGVAAGRAG